MRKLSEAIPEILMHKEGKLHKIMWKDDPATSKLLKNLADKISRMSMPEILGFGVLQEIGTDLLPKFTQSALKPYFASAREGAAQEIEEWERKAADGEPTPEVNDHTKVKTWLKKIRRIPETLPFGKASILPRVESAIHKALLFDQPIKIETEREEFSVVVSPRALVQRGARTYLFAHNHRTDACEPFGLHKIRSANRTTEAFIPPGPGFDLDLILKGGIADPFFPREVLGESIDLEMWIDDGTNRWISATPLAKNQRTSKAGIGYNLYAKVPLSEELVWWILSMSYHVKVFEPQVLVDRVKADAWKMANLYKAVATSKKVT